jgi:hypothetical protein
MAHLVQGSDGNHDALAEILLPFSIEDKIKMLKEEKLSERIMIAIRSLNKVRHLLRIQTEIENKTHYDLMNSRRNTSSSSRSRTSGKNWEKATPVRRRRRFWRRRKRRTGAKRQPKSSRKKLPSSTP